ncbi:hypothetical protein RN001_015261 [Aquatica leii]|uniref:Uncharacterized protein n=1 Tax=Aquatica leii TaxID=1421715 RepID=A0AAN7PQK1_9COLE|nr:hypothetical protein RN001_015261 [Aquatica leii]
MDPARPSFEGAIEEASAIDTIDLPGSLPTEPPSEGNRVEVACDGEIVQLRQMLVEQQRMLAEFMANQRSVNESLLSSINRGTGSESSPRQDNGGPSVVQVSSVRFAAASTPTAPSTIPIGHPLFNPGVTPSSPNPDLDSSWKTVALNLSNQTPLQTAVDKPFFRPGKIHPKIFLRRFDRYFTTSRLPVSEKVNIIKEYLRGSASDWADLKECAWTTFRSFEDDFMSHYWSEDQQYLERQRLSAMIFSPNGPYSIDEYFLKQANLYKLFDPPLPESVIVSEIMKQLPGGTQSLWTVVPDRSLAGALAFLERQKVPAAKRLRLSTTRDVASFPQSFNVPPPVLPSRSSGNARGGQLGSYVTLKCFKMLPLSLYGHL